MNVTKEQITYLDLDRGTNGIRVEDCYIDPCYALYMEAKHWNICIASNIFCGLQKRQEIGMISC